MNANIGSLRNYRAGFHNCKEVMPSLYLYLALVEGVKNGIHKKKPQHSVCGGF